MPTRHSFFLTAVAATALAAASARPHLSTTPQQRHLATQKRTGAATTTTTVTVTVNGDSFELKLGLKGLPAVSGFDDDEYEKVAVGSYSVMKQAAQYSWEWGTQSEVAVELFYPGLGVFSESCPYPLSCGDWTDDNATTVPSELFYIIDPILASHPSTTWPQPLVNGNGAAGDPCSLGMATLLCGATNTTGDAEFYTVPAEEQLAYITQNVSRNWDDGISQRDVGIQFWTDNGYMVPPYLAYSGALEGNLSLLTLAYQQHAAYRNFLMDNATNLWSHIEPDENETYDTGFWSTGMGWTAAGMMRTLASLFHVPDEIRPQTLSMREDLRDWTTEMLAAVWAEQDPVSSLLPNYYDVPRNQSDAYYECAGTALLASASFRLAALTGDASHVPAATNALNAMVKNNINSTTFVLGPVVNPLAGWSDPGPLEAGGVSAEAQGFVVAMLAAYRDLGNQTSGWAML